MYVPLSFTYYYSLSSSNGCGGGGGGSSSSSTTTTAAAAASTTTTTTTTTTTSFVLKPRLNTYVTELWQQEWDKCRQQQMTPDQFKITYLFEFRPVVQSSSSSLFG